MLDSGLFPLANSPHFAGLVITEVNPDHDPDCDLIRALIAVIAEALSTVG